MSAHATRRGVYLHAKVHFVQVYNYGFPGRQAGSSSGGLEVGEWLQERPRYLPPYLAFPTPPACPALLSGLVPLSTSLSLSLSLSLFLPPSLPLSLSAFNYFALDGIYAQLRDTLRRACYQRLTKGLLVKFSLEIHILMSFVHDGEDVLKYTIDNFGNILRIKTNFIEKILENISDIRYSNSEMLETVK